MGATYYNPIGAITILGGSLVILILFTGRGSAEEIDADRVVKELRSGIVRLQTAETRLAAWEGKVEISGKAGQTASATCIVKRHEKSFLMEYKKIRVINNSTEVFAVKPTFLSGEWALTRYTKPGTDRVWKEWNHDCHFQFYPLLSALIRNSASASKSLDLRRSHKDLRRENRFTYQSPLLSVTGGSTILHILDDPTFVTKRARRAADNRVELDYEYIPSAGDTAAAKIVTTGTFTLAPDLDWLAVKSITRTSGGPIGQIDCTMERQALRDGDSIRVVATTYGCKTANDQYNRNSKFTYKILPPDTVDPSEFTLDYYSITAPEQDVYEDRRQFNWTLWGSIGAICIALSLVLGWIVRRRRTT